MKKFNYKEVNALLNKMEKSLDRIAELNKNLGKQKEQTIKAA